MEEELKNIVASAKQKITAVTSRAGFEAIKAEITGPNGALTKVMKNMGAIPKEDRPTFGKLINQAKTQIQGFYDDVFSAIEQAELAARIGPAIDPSLPSPNAALGSQHPLTKVREEICSIFKQIGFTVTEGTEVETEYYCFDALNTPADHPARDLQDTFYLPDDAQFGNVSKKSDERYLLRTHTSSVQIRTMLKEKPPLRIISPGRCFRRDTVDATHSANFHQIEGLYIDEDVTVRDLKAVLDYFFERLLGKGTKTRFRPHFFPYTEPSFEVDFSSSHLAKLGSEWVEIAGCGMVEPAVFDSVGYDPEKYSGFAFGMGIERIAMILYGIDDIRYFYQNDARFLSQFA
ncbi:phenylalanyl-tRNA synthetase, alpha subunit [Verrucomicrobiia bacterium DG1235]|nr:phenylalanyl-tRNA synthetase, alpha subunit [Verrucomicrobiae bacterium DG1235]